MKIKKFLLSLLAAGAVFTLAGCTGGNQRQVSDFNWFIGHEGKSAPVPADEGDQGSNGQKACEAALAKTLCYNSRSTAMIADKVTDFDADTNQYLYLVTKITVKVQGEEYICDVKWAYDSNSPSFGGIRYFWEDKTHAQIDLKYPGIGEAERDFALTATVKCGSATASKSQNYFAHLKAPTLQYDSITIADVYKLNAAGTNFDIVDEAQDYFKPNHGQKYFYCKVKGKVNYCAPDGNWGLISDGNQVMEIYAGAGTKLTEEFFPALGTGYVEVVGNLSMYLGNIQIGYIYQINALSDHSMIAEPTGWNEVTTENYANVHQYTPLWMNGFWKVSATYNGNIKDSNGNDITDPSKIVDKRFTFEVKVGDKVLVIAWDYHADNGVTDADAGLGIFNEFKAKIVSLKVGDPVNIKGTMRFVRTEGVFKDKGAWNLVPFYKGQLA